MSLVDQDPVQGGCGLLLAAHVEHAGIVRRRPNADRGRRYCQLHGCPQPDCRHATYSVEHAQPAPDSRYADRCPKPNCIDRDARADRVSNCNAHAACAYADAIAYAPDADPHPASDADHHGHDAADGDTDACL